MTHPSRVLIVADDQMASSRAIVVLGADSDCSVMTTRPGDARESARSFAPEIIVVDAASLDLVPSLRAERPAVPVLAVTSNPTVEQAIKAIRVGASDYLESFTDRELRGHVTRLCVAFREETLVERPGFAMR